MGINEAEAAMAAHAELWRQDKYGGTQAPYAGNYTISNDGHVRAIVGGEFDLTMLVRAVAEALAKANAGNSHAEPTIGPISSLP